MTELYFKDEKRQPPYEAPIEDHFGPINHPLLIALSVGVIVVVLSHLV